MDGSMAPGPTEPPPPLPPVLVLGIWAAQGSQECLKLKHIAVDHKEASHVKETGTCTHLTGIRTLGSVVLSHYYCV